jgi:hypothetical protein
MNKELRNNEDSLPNMQICVGFYSVKMCSYQKILEVSLLFSLSTYYILVHSFHMFKKRSEDP